MAMVFAQRFAIRGTLRNGSGAKAGKTRVAAQRNTALPQILSGAIFAAALLSLPYPSHAGGYAYGPGPVCGYGYRALAPAGTVDSIVEKETQ